MTETALTAALARRNTGRPPVWFMRQAGRYHSHYQGLKRQVDFITLCKDPLWAAETAMGPVHDFNFDAAILFSDLLFPLEVMGMGLRYDPGPKLDFHLQTTADLARLQVGAALLAIEQVGAAQHLLDLSVDYAKSRLQFGRQIGSFQAIKHKLADMLVDLEHARSAAYHAVWALSGGTDDPALAVSIAQALSSAALQRIASDTIQVHGGIGFTWEHQAQLYFKRAATDAALLGSAEQHRSRVADLVLDTAIAHSGAAKVANGRL